MRVPTASRTQRPVVGDQDHRAVVGARAFSRASRLSTSRVVGRLVRGIVTFAPRRRGSPASRRSSPRRKHSDLLLGVRPGEEKPAQQGACLAGVRPVARCVPLEAGSCHRPGGCCDRNVSSTLCSFGAACRPPAAGPRVSRSARLARAVRAHERHKASRSSHSSASVINVVRFVKALIVASSSSRETRLLRRGRPNLNPIDLPSLGSFRGGPFLESF